MDYKVKTTKYQNPFVIRIEIPDYAQRTIRIEVDVARARF